MASNRSQQVIDKTEALYSDIANQEQLDVIKKHFDGPVKPDLSMEVDKGKNPVHYATARGRLDVLEFFIEQKANLDLPVGQNGREYAGMTALDIATKEANSSIIDSQETYKPLIDLLNKNNAKKHEVAFFDKKKETEQKVQPITLGYPGQTQIEVVPKTNGTPLEYYAHCVARSFASLDETPQGRSNALLTFLQSITTNATTKEFFENTMQSGPLFLELKNNPTKYTKDRMPSSDDEIRKTLTEYDLGVFEKSFKIKIERRW